MLRTDDFNKTLLLLASWRETIEYGGHLGALMVMGCLRNRVQLGWGSWVEVIKNIPKYHASLEIPNKDVFPASLWDANFVRLLHEVDSQYDGSGVDYAKGGLYWSDLRRIDNPWFKEKILDGGHSRVADMNSLVIWK